METIISSLLKSFDKRTLTRRELMQGLGLMAATSGVSAQARVQADSIKGARIDHVSIQVIDLPKVVDFYWKVFGFTIVSEDKPNEIVRLGTKSTIVSLHHKSPTGLVDHFAIGVESFNKAAVTQQLRQLGITPEPENIDAGFHIKDPEGMNVQIV